MGANNSKVIKYFYFTCNHGMNKSKSLCTKSWSSKTKKFLVKYYNCAAGYYLHSATDPMQHVWYTG